MNIPAAHRPSRPASSSDGENPFLKWTLIAVAGLFSVVFLVLPLANVFVQAFAKGWSVYKGALTNPETIAAIKLTLLMAAVTVPMNLVFGIACSWCIAKFDFRGKSLLLTLIDLPFSVSPVVAGLMFILLFGLQGYFGEWLDAHDVKIIFAVPGMLLVTLFVTLPFIARELIPVMQASGSDQEAAALTLGASGWQTFWHVTLPSIKWALLYGVILSTARAMGEFGAVSVVSGNIVGESHTLPLRVEYLYKEYKGAEAFAVATLLVALALVTLCLKALLEKKVEQ